MTKITVDPFLTEIQSNSFEKYIKLEHLIYGESVKKIEKYNYENIGDIKEITNPSSITSIENESLINNIKLAKIEIETPSTLTTIGTS